MSFIVAFMSPFLHLHAPASNLLLPQPSRANLYELRDCYFLLKDAVAGPAQRRRIVPRPSVGSARIQTHWACGDVGPALAVIKQ